MELNTLIKFCRHCGKEIPADKKHRRVFCSQHCTREHARAMWRAQNPRPEAKLPTGTTGARNELRVCADLMARGFHVYRAVSPAAPCDLLVQVGDMLCRIEVTTGNRLASGKVTHPTKNPCKFDVLAVVTGDDICYDPPFGGLPAVDPCQSALQFSFLA